MNGARADHLAWAKARALEYLEPGPRCDSGQAFASLGSDLNKHPEAADHVGLALGMMELMAGRLQSPAAMRTFIEGFR